MVGGEAGGNPLTAVRKSADGVRGRIGQLLSCRGAGGNGRAAARAAGVGWSRDLGDPEFGKNLRIWDRLIDEGIRLCERGAAPKGFPERFRARLDGSSLGTGTATDRSDLPCVSIERLLADRFALERLLVAAGDDEYLRTRSGELYDEGPGTQIHWNDLFDVRPPLLDRFDVPPPPGASIVARTPPPGPSPAGERTRYMLGRLLAAKASRDFPERARRELKRRVLVRMVLPVVGLAVLVFAIAIAVVLDDDLWLLASSAGAAGASLGGLLSLRDDVSRGAQVREFTPLFIGRLIVGAAAGLLAFVVTESGAVEVGGGAAGLAAFGFVLGFSEAAFLRLVNRIGSAVGGEESDTETDGVNPPTAPAGVRARPGPAASADGTHRVIASFTVLRPEDEERFVQAALEDASRSVADEPGTLRLELVRDERRWGHYVLDETYASREAFERHAKGPHFAQFFEMVEDLEIRWHEIFRGDRLDGGR